MNQNIQAPHPVQHQQYAPAGYWVPGGPPRPKSSGFRVAAGIIAIVQGCALMLPAFLASQYSIEASYPAAIVAALFSLTAAIGNLTCGIVLLAKHRSRRRGAPIAVLFFAAFTLLIGLCSILFGMLYAFLLILPAIFSIPTIIVMGIGLAKEKPGR